MELRHLRYFVGVAETLNFRAAAANLHVSAPALSRQIKDLEEEMGLRLFDRTTTKVRLTDAGLVFLGEARALLAGASRAQALAKETVSGVRGQFRVGYNSALLAEYMPECLALYATRSPQIHVELVDFNSADQISALKNDDIQLGFVAPLKAWAPPAALADVSVFHAMPRAVFGRGHRLASESIVSMADLTHERIMAISGPKWPMHRDNIHMMFKASGLQPPKIIEVERLDALLAMVAGGDGITLLAWQRSMAYPQQIALIPLKESGPGIELNIRAVWPKANGSGLCPGFVAVLREVANRGRLATAAR